MPERSRTDRRLHVGLIMPGGFEIGGIGRLMMYVTDAWSGEDLHWQVLDPRGKGSLIWMPFHSFAVLLRIALSRLAGRLDLAHIHVAGRGSTLRKIIVVRWCRWLRIPIILHLHDYNYAADFNARSPAGRRRVRQMFQSASRVVVLGKRDAAFVHEIIGVEAERLTVLHNAVPDPGPPLKRGEEARRLEMLFLGHLSDRKGVGELLRALARPELRERAWRVTLAGGEEVERFQRMAAELGLDGKCVFTGWIDAREVAGLLGGADIFVLPSHAEGQSMALLEAMAYGLAIVTTPVGSHLEAVRDGEQALVVRPGDETGLAEALARLIDDAEHRARLGGAARRRYEEGFSIQRYAPHLTRIYAEVLDGSS